MSISAFAGVVGKDAAAEYAESFLNHGIKTNSTRVSAPMKLVRETPTYYIYNKPEGGWVIMSAEDSVEPILAFSETGSIDISKLSDNFEWWMSGISKEIEAVRELGLPRLASWDNVAPTATVIKKYETAKWDQLNPYNLQCPTINGSRAYTGCVATAASIVCRYHEWPQSVTGTTTPYWYEVESGEIVFSNPNNSKYRSMAARTITGTYDYSLMPLTYTNSASTAQKNAVADLMADIGYSCFMMYGGASDGGSGAYTEYLVDALINFFGYKNTAVLRTRSRYSDSSWISMLKAELDSNGPIIYGGSDPSGGGHQFIFDGYRDDNYFSVNWGWSGDANGYFLITKLGGTSVGYTFSQYQDAVLGLTPDGKAEAGPTAAEIAAATSLSYDRTTGALSLKSTLALDYEIKLSATTIDSGTLVVNKAKSIDASNYAPGSYTLNLKSGTVTYSLVIKL